MARVLFTMGDVQRAYFAEPMKNPITGQMMPSAVAPPAVAAAPTASQAASSTYTRVRNGIRRIVRKGRVAAAKVQRAVANNKIVQNVDQAAGSLIQQTGQAAQGVGSHIGRNAGKYALGAAALGAAAGGAAYLMNRDRNRQNYSRRVRTIYFSRRSY